MAGKKNQKLPIKDRGRQNHGSNGSRRKPRKTAIKAQKPLWRKAVYGLMIVGVWGFMLGLIGLGYLAHDLPDLENLAAPGVNDNAVIVKAANGSTLVRSGPIYGDWISFEETPDALVRAFVSVEDRYFFEHPGFDIKGLARALVTNVRAGGVRAGGSTITQQLAKNLFLSNKRNVTRKAQELLLAFWLEQKFTKEQILSLYLNRVYFGGGAYGIDAAAQKYFGHSAKDLSISESAMIAGLVQSPSRLAPHINPEGAWKRAKIVLGAMAENGALTPEAAAKLKNQPPTIQVDKVGNNVRYFTDWVLQQLDRLTPGAMRQSLVVYTTLDPGIQRAAALALERGLATEGETRNIQQGAILALDHDGAIRAMVGGRNYLRSQYNRTTQAKRQPGSAFKLFSYLAALEKGVKPDDTYVDRKITIDGWSPKNYTGRFSGRMTAEDAFARSINTIAVQISEEAGRESVAAMAKRLGITSRVDPLASLPLGTEEVTMLELSGAYASIANGGFSARGYGILEVTTLSGEVLYRRTAERPIPVLAYPVVKDMSHMLTSVIEYGSGKNAKLDRPAAGKSGTSQDSRDAVFTGFTSDITATVWLGNDDGSPMKGVTGGSIPARIWRDFMIEAHAGQQVRPLLADAGLYGAFSADDVKKVIDQRRTEEKKKKSLLQRLFGGEN
ncbi:penicillin-binding protein [Kordiimonas sediminis]|uniref:Penicillin-binding protein n=1 Tax=Kordiimonas sediminis TaxID=1735581 RepID=A0A919AMX8_9PROT|nr:PBP1A family penicillin-binding protein [Kordiimonas sediminis]GHF16190.1 penicillin-binding protein [Kordiimonas sediminis]